VRSLFPQIPVGMAIGDFNVHPIRQTLQTAAAKNHLGMPSNAQLDALHLSPGSRQKLLVACREVADIFAEFEQQRARDVADHRAAEILSGLPTEMRDPHYLDPPGPDYDAYRPDQLAALVTKRGF
jgi:hypothetical protein